MADRSTYRTRILDAAEACLMEQRMSAPLHARIAERAGVSRPTVYKYVGDQDEIFRAVMERLAGRYVHAVTPELARPMPLREHFAHLTAFSVDFFRRSPLTQALVAHDSARFLAWLTDTYPDVVRAGVRPLVPAMHEAMPTTRDLPIPLEELLEWGVRITFALVFMPSAHRRLDTRAEIEAYVDGFLSGFVHRP